MFYVTALPRIVSLSERISRAIECLYTYFTSKHFSLGQRGADVRLASQFRRYRVHSLSALLCFFTVYVEDEKCFFAANGADRPVRPNGPLRKGTKGTKDIVRRWINSSFPKWQFSPWECGTVTLPSYMLPLSLLKLWPLTLWYSVKTRIFRWQKVEVIVVDYVVVLFPILAGFDTSIVLHMIVIPPFAPQRKCPLFLWVLVSVIIIMFGYSKMATR